MKPRAGGASEPRHLERPYAEVAKFLAAESAARGAGEAAERWLGPLHRAAGLAVTGTSLDSLLREALAAIASALDADSAAILVADERAGRLVGRAAVGLSKEIDLELDIRAGEGVSGRVLASAAPLIIDDLHQVEVSSPVLRESGLRSYVGVPLVAGGRVVGVAHATSFATSQFLPEDAALLRMLADPLAAAIERVRLFEREAGARKEAERARRAAELAVGRLTWLQHMTAALAAAGDAIEICAAATEAEPPGELAGAQRSVWLLEDGGLRRAAAVPEAHASAGGDTDPPPWAKEALESGAPVHVPEGAAARARWPKLGDGARRAVAVLPLTVEERCFGVFALELDEGREVTLDDQAVLAAVAEQISLALDRARLHALDVRSHQRQALLADAAVLSSGALDPVEILRRLTVVAVPRLGEWCAALMSLRGRLELVAATPVEPAPTAGGGDGGGGGGPAGDTRRSDVDRLLWPELITDLTDPVQSRRFPVLDRFAGEAEGRAGMAVPWRARGEGYGVALFVSARGAPRYDETDLGMATELVGRAVAALDNAAVRFREQSVTAMLTRAILPERLPALDGLEIAARYLPGEGGPVGGDWYDVFEVRGGRLGLVVGDASGHGVEAASLMVRLRNGLRAYAAGGDRPSAVLRQLAELVDAPDADWDEAAFATVAYAQHDAATGALAIASAGHPPALRVSSGRARFSRPGGRPLLKGFPGPRFADRTMTLGEGDLIVLYSDGLVEDPGQSIDEGMARLARVVVEASGQGLEDLCDTVIEKTCHASNRRDDCCLLVVRVTGAAGAAAGR